MLRVDPLRNGAQGADMQLIVYEPIKADKKAFVEFWKERLVAFWVFVT